MYVIPITEETLDLIEVLNNGVRPEMEGVSPTYFIYHTDKPAEIVNHEGTFLIPCCIREVSESKDRSQ